VEHKAFRVTEIKTADAPGDEPGTFEALVSVFGNVDGDSDRMVKGAFARTLQTKGLPPIVWSHDWGVPPIGAASHAEEVDEGLLVKGRLFVGDGEDSPTARAVYTAMKAKDGNDQPVLREFSFGFQVADSRQVEEKGAKVREILDVDLFEVGPTLVGANDQTRLLAVKGRRISQAALTVAALKADRTLSSANETLLSQAEELISDARAEDGPLGQAEALLETVLSSVDSTYSDPDDNPVSQQGAPKAGRPVGAKGKQDNAAPNAPEGAEEARSRIAELALAQPRHRPGRGYSHASRCEAQGSH
jgi:HK97 family phage prohead protease